MMARSVVRVPQSGRRRVVMPAILGLVAVLSLFLVTGCGGGGASPSGAPVFSGVTLDGSEVSNATFLGRPTVLVFWGTW
jgi:hypothetical protein